MTTSMYTVTGFVNVCLCCVHVYLFRYVVLSCIRELPFFIGIARLVSASELAPAPTPSPAPAHQNFLEGWNRLETRKEQRPKNAPAAVHTMCVDKTNLVFIRQTIHVQLAPVFYVRLIYFTMSYTLRLHRLLLLRLLNWFVPE